MKSEIWDKVHCYGMFILSVIYLIRPAIYLFVIFSILSILVLWVTGWKSLQDIKPPGGIPNYITLLRFVPLVSLTVFSGQLSNATIAIVLFVLILLDGADGYFARKLNQQTEFGALFDMETDALFVCLVSCLLISRGLAGNWLLPAAFLRYYYVVLISITGYDKVTEKRSKFGAAIAVIMFAVLAAGFILPIIPRTIILLFGILLLFVSFGRSFVGKI